MAESSLKRTQASASKGAESMPLWEGRAYNGRLTVSLRLSAGRDGNAAKRLSYVSDILLGTWIDEGVILCVGAWPTLREASDGRKSLPLPRNICRMPRQGYMSEALKPATAFGFNHLSLNRLYAYHMLRNPSSGKVLQKSGFVQEGVLRQRVRKWGVFEDVALWAILRQDWLGNQ
jgi:hypothetical protein